MVFKKGNTLRDLRRNKNGDFQKGEHASSETEFKKSNTLGFRKGINRKKEINPNWKGGYEIARARSEEKRRQFGFIPLNTKFDGSDGHHLDEEFVVYIPTELHRSIYHCVRTGINMDKINDLAIDYIFKDTKITIANLI